MRIHFLSSVAILLTVSGCSDSSGGSAALQSDVSTFSSNSYSEDLINDARKGIEPNYWDCELSQQGVDTTLELTYQFFSDERGAILIGTNSETFSWYAPSDTEGDLVLASDGGGLGFERWFFDITSNTTFSADIGYSSAAHLVTQITQDQINAQLDCILFSDDTAVNTDDLPESLLNDESGTPLSDATTAELIVNDNSSFGLENNLWFCISGDKSLDLLFGFYPLGVSGTYSTQNGLLEGSQSSYTVSGDAINITAVLNNQTTQLEFTNVEFHRTTQFSAQLALPLINFNGEMSCDIIPLVSLQT